MPWHNRRFRKTGQLWREGQAANVRDWPPSAVVCNCMSVTRGNLGECIAEGCGSVEAIQKSTGASTVCGSCRPLLSDLLGTPAATTEARGWKSLAGFSAAALVVALLILLLNPIPYTKSVQEAIQLDVLWTDPLYKQISGFTLVGLSLLGLLMSLRKRWRRFQFGGFEFWRLLHAGLGALVLVFLIVHTGLRMGENLNLMLMIAFLAVNIMGAFSGAITALEHRLEARAAMRLRKVTTGIHIFFCWPLPVLIGFHILAVYYF